VSAELLFENAEFLAVNKPSGWHSTQGKTKSITIESWLAEHFESQKSLPESGLLHRLDLETSGVLLAARNLDVYQEWCARLRSGQEVQKIYWAVCDPRPPGHEFIFYFSSRYRGSKKVSVSSHGKASERGQCRWRILHQEAGAHLVEVMMMGGGLRHQIRAGFAKIGSPLLGDSLYGGRHAPYFGLHARELRWSKFSVQAPPPRTWFSHTPK
jgi:23S rRNA pseudouridine1911/1915/1917 synthase